MNFGPIHGNAFTLAAALEALAYDQITNTNTMLSYKQSRYVNQDDI